MESFNSSLENTQKILGLYIGLGFEPLAAPSCVPCNYRRAPRRNFLGPRDGWSFPPLHPTMLLGIPGAPPRAARVWAPMGGRAQDSLVGVVKGLLEQPLPCNKPSGFEPGRV